MIECWSEAGQRYDLFWDLSPVEFNAVMAGHRRRCRNAIETAAYGAWWSGLLSQWDPKQYPEMDFLLPKTMQEAPQEQTLEEQLAAMDAIVRHQNRRCKSTT